MGRYPDHRAWPIISRTSARPGARPPGPRLAAAPSLRHRALASAVRTEVAAGAQDAVLGGVQAPFRARDPAGRLPEREDAIPLPLFVCPCQEGTVLFRRLPGMGVHGFTSLRGLVAGSVRASSVSVSACLFCWGRCGRGRPGPATASQAATSVFRGRPRGRLRGMTSPRRKSSPPQTPHGSRRCHGAGEARDPDGAPSAQGLGRLDIRWGLGEKQVRIRPAGQVPGIAHPGIWVPGRACPTGLDVTGGDATASVSCLVTRNASAASNPAAPPAAVVPGQYMSVPSRPRRSARRVFHSADTAARA